MENWTCEECEKLDELAKSLGDLRKGKQTKDGRKDEDGDVEMS